MKIRVASNEKKPVVFFSAEMDGNQLIPFSFRLTTDDWHRDLGKEDAKKDL